MVNIPTGLVTFLFTDIEGSTKLAQEYPETLNLALEKHYAILTNAIELYNGYVFKTVGDAFCCSFGNSEDAVHAAVKAQTDLSEENWNDAVIKNRIGIHSGDAEWRGSDYMGYITLAKINRIMSVAHGGQIIISDEVYKSLTVNPGSSSVKAVSQKYNITFRDLGERRFKDLIHPVRIYQIISPGLRESFPPLKTLDARPNNLPSQLTNFIGREKQLKEIKSLLSDSRLLTLLGPGGTGKSRLSLQTGTDLIDHFENGVWFVELASISDPSYLSREIASVLKLSSDGKKEIMDLLITFLKGKELFLILDNCEHLINECAKICEQLLRSSPKLKILVTSREILHADGEIVYAVPSLSLPDLKGEFNLKSLLQYESVRLFVDRAMNVNPNFELTEKNSVDVAHLCLDLDGIPLAIELAAARLRVLPVDKILERIKNRFHFLTGGNRTSLPRQQTLKALIDWSYDLLSDKEKLLWQRLSIFSGGWSLEAAEEICTDYELSRFDILDLLNNLIDKSIVKANEINYETRYTMLETIRQYAYEKLAGSDESMGLQKKYFDFFCNFVVNSETKLTGSDQRAFIKKINLENENIRKNLSWALLNEPDSALIMSVELGRFWEVQSRFNEGIEFLTKSLEGSKEIELSWKAKVIYWLGFFLIQKGKYDNSKEYLQNCLKTFREIKDKSWEARTLFSIGVIALYESDYENIDLYSNASLVLSRELKDKSYIARNIQTIASGLMEQCKYDDARSMFEECLSLFRELNDSVNQAKIIGNVGLMEYWLGNYEIAIHALEESLALRMELNDRQGMSIALNNLGSVKYMQQNLDEALHFLKESLKISEELGDKRIQVISLNTVGLIFADTSEFTKSMEQFSDVLFIAREIGDKYSLAKGFDGFTLCFLRLERFDKSCIACNKYVTLLKLANRNLIDAEFERFEMFKTKLKENLGDADFEKYWQEADRMSTDEAIEFVTGQSIVT